MRLNCKMALGTIKTTALLAFIIMLFASCAENGTAVPQQPQNLVEQSLLNPSILPPIPSGKELSRTTFETTAGIATFERFGTANELGSTLELLAGVDGLSFAIYRFNPGIEHISKVQVMLSVFVEASTYVALADYSLGLWDIQGPVSGDTDLNLADAWHRSPAGNYYVAVITSGGSSRVIELIATLDNRWTVVTVDSSGPSGMEASNTSLTTIDDKPAIAYYARADKDLKFAWSSSFLGDTAGAWSSEFVDTGGEVGEYCSLANVNGVPGISYHDATNQHLKYARRMSVGDWRTTTVDNTPLTGEYTSLAVVTGKPCISYLLGGGATDLMYARSSSDYGIEDGIVIWVKVVVDESFDVVGIGTSIAEVDGTPAIAYYDYTNINLKYARSTAADGINFRSWELKYIAGLSGLDAGLAPSLAVVDGNPAVIYSDYDSGTTKYRRSFSMSGIDSASWDPAVDFDPGAEYASYDSSLAVVGGYPAIAYLDQNTGELKYAISSLADGNDASSWLNTVVDDEGFPGEHCSLAEVNGRPAISYFDRSSGDLKYAIYVGP